MSRGIRQILVIIAVKGYDLEQAIRDIKNQVGKDTIIPLH